MKTRLKLSLIAAAALAVSIGVYLKPPRDTAPVVGLAPVTLSPLALPIAQPDASPAPTTVTVAPETKRPLQTPVAWSKAKEFDRLAKGNVQEKYQAYRLVEECLLSQHLPKYNPQLTTDPKVCGDLQPGQLAARTELIKEAGLAGVHRAWFALKLLEGPGGMWPSLPNTPETQQLIDQAYAAAIATADPNALTSRIPKLMKSASLSDQALALTYQVAFLHTSAHDLGRPMANVEANPVVISLTNKLPPDVAKKAIADGEQLARRAPK